MQRGWFFRFSGDIGLMELSWDESLSLGMLACGEMPFSWMGFSFVLEARCRWSGCISGCDLHFSHGCHDVMLDFGIDLLLITPYTNGIRMSCLGR